MSQPRPYKPDVAYLEQDLVNTLIRNLNDIARVINREISADEIDFSNFTFPSTDGISEEENYFVKKWRISDAQIIPADEIYATTGVVFTGEGRLRIDGRLKQL
jgi:hypothetical protein